MSQRYQGGILGVGFNPLQAPNAPTIGAATAPTATTASVAFTAPANVGGSAITSYVVVSSGGQVVTGASSPITVTGLTTGTAYTFRVTALNSYGPSPISAASNSVTPTAIGQQAFTSPGTFSWVAPAGVTSVCVVCVGGGGGYGAGSPFPAGGGGGLAYKNNIAVTPGNSYTVVVGSNGGGGADGGTSSFLTLSATGGINGFGTRLGGAPSGTYDGGGSGGTGGQSNWNGSSRSTLGGGGGAGGYSGNGGNGADVYIGGSQGGTGGAGGGGGYGYTGGGVGLLGQGSSGDSSSVDGNPGSGGFGNNYGGGGDGYFAATGPGAVRIIWGAGRAFPSTNTGNL